jgi:hypothetical protein
MTGMKQGTKFAWDINEGSEEFCFEGSLVRNKYGFFGNHKYMTAAMLPRFKGNDMA